MSGEKQLAVRRWMRVATLFAIVVAMAVAAQSAQHPNRITQDLNTGGVVTLPGSVHRLTRLATDLGQVSPSMQLGSMSMYFGPSPQQQIDLDALTKAQQDPKSPLYHHWLTQEEYGKRFGLTEADLIQVKNWLAGQGFTVQSVAKSRNSIRFSGQAWQVESAFQTQLHYYQLNGQRHFANATQLRVPAGLRGVVMVVRGLTSFRPKPALRRPAYTTNTTQGQMNFLSPADWATIYGVNAIYSAGYTGNGSYVGVVGQTYVPQSDIDHFRSAAQLSSTKLTYVCIDPNTSQCTGTSAISTAGDLGEADLDIEWAGGIAKDATVVYLYAPYSVVDKAIDPSSNQYYDVFDAMEHAVVTYTVPATGKVLPVISLSYTDCEQSFQGDASYQSWISALGQQANTQGQTIVAATGDTGAAGCDFGNYPAQNGQSATIPVDSPNFTGVGGTTLSGDSTSPSLYWNEVDGQVSTAKAYIPETVWNDTDPWPCSSASCSLSTPGGGVSQYFSQPIWQPTPSGYSGATGRFVPDVAFAASPNHDGYLTCSQDTASNDCSSGFWSGTGGGATLDVVGGTSAGAPSFAGMLTVLEQKYGPQGNLNPMLYEMAADPGTYGAVFHDTQSGDNLVPCIFQTTGCNGGSSTTAGTMGWSASTGYDLASGLGSIDGGALVTAIAAAGSAATTTTTVQSSPSSTALNSTMTLSATVTSATPGTINGQVTFTVNGTQVGQAWLSGGTATLSNVAVTAANGFAEGTATVNATYSGGDSIFSGSSGSMQLTVAASTEPPMAFTVGGSANPTVSLSPGGSTTVTVTLTSTAYTGTVQMSILPNNSAISVTPTSKTLSVSPGTYTFNVTISASQTATGHTPALPWKSGGAIAFAVLLGAPFTVRKKSSLMVLLMALALLPIGMLTSCGARTSSISGSGGGGGGGAASYTVTVTPVTTPAASPLPAPLVITVNVS